MQMPATTQQLVQLMFGEELAPHTREQVTIGQPVLQLNNVHLKNARLDMPDISLNIREGEVIGLAGLDGSGQELLMRACAGLISLQSGSILLEDSSIENLSYRQRLQNGLVFGAAGRLEEGLIAGLTLSEHLALMIDEERFIDWNHIEKNMEQRIEKYDIRGRKTDNIEQLSGGNQQRVLMALLPSEPKVLILEQPTRGLDVDSARWIWTQLLERRKTGTAILFSSAELDEIVAYSDRIWVFYTGRIHEVADPSQTDIDSLGHLIGGDTFDWDSYKRDRRLGLI
jgi:simple sugar transport system ATP-binding protein